MGGSTTRCSVEWIQSFDHRAKRSPVFIATSTRQVTIGSEGLEVRLILLVPGIGVASTNVPRGLRTCKPPRSSWNKRVYSHSRCASPPSPGLYSSQTPPWTALGNAAAEACYPSRQFMGQRTPHRTPTQLRWHAWLTYTPIGSHSPQASAILAVGSVLPLSLHWMFVQTYFRFFAIMMLHYSGVS